MRLDLWRGDYIWAILAVIGFPITFIIWPWNHEPFGTPSGCWVAAYASAMADRRVCEWCGGSLPPAS